MYSAHYLYIELTTHTKIRSHPAAGPPSSSLSTNKSIGDTKLSSTDCIGVYKRYRICNEQVKKNEVK